MASTPGAVMLQQKRDVLITSRFFYAARPAAILIANPRIAALNKKPITECASTVRRKLRVATATSEVWTATLMVNEK